MAWPAWLATVAIGQPRRVFAIAGPAVIDSDERVILVTETDVELGEAPKLEVHRTGQLHRAFSVFIFDDQGRLLLQRRALRKYHSPGLWSNSCCGHPRPGERTSDAARRRLNEEMGLDCYLTDSYTFVYLASLDGGLIEHELDHVLIGFSSTDPRPNPAEVEEWRWCDIDAVNESLRAEPTAFSAWFAPAFERLVSSRNAPAAPAAPAAP